MVLEFCPEIFLSRKFDPLFKTDSLLIHFKQTKKVRLKKRVVQVWFQNTRARERKGIIKMNTNTPVSSSSSTHPSSSLAANPSLLAATSSQSNSASTPSSSTSSASASASANTSSSSISSQSLPKSARDTTTAVANPKTFCKRCPFCTGSPLFPAQLFLNRSELESHMILKHNFTCEQTSSFDIDLFPDAPAGSSPGVVVSPSASPASHAAGPDKPKQGKNALISPTPISPMQNLYTSFLLQQQQQQQQQQFPSALFQNALLQQQQQGTNSMLMSSLFAHLQQQQQHHQQDIPLDLSSALALNSLLSLGNSGITKDQLSSLQAQLAPQQSQTNLRYAKTNSRKNIRFSAFDGPAQLHDF